MPARKPKTLVVEGEELYTIHPIEGVYIMGVPTKTMQVTEAEWLRLNEYQPPAFVCDPLPPPDDAPAQEEE